MNMSVIDFAHEILEMQQTIAWQRSELKRLEKIEADYNRLLNESIEHGNRMMGNMLQVLLTPGVTKAFLDSAESVQP